MRTPPMTVAEVAKRLGISEWMVRHYVHKGELRHMGVSGVYLFQVLDVVRFEDAIGKPGVPEVAGMLNVPEDTVRKWVSRGLLRSEKVAGKRKFKKEDVAVFARDRGLIIREPVEGGDSDTAA